MHTKTLAQLSAGLKAGEYSSVELTQHFLSRIEQFDSTLNSFITVTPEQALEQAKIADARRAAGDASDLTGIPIAHKDIFCTQGVRTSCASKMLDNFISPYDATVVTKLAEAGVVCVGKTNMDEFAMGSSNETSYYGPVRNPWNTDCVPGGSSGGSAAAMSASLAAAVTGTDTGGSIRQPAALTGITGLKPTYGRVSRYGMIAFASSLDQAGPMTKTAEDAAMMLQAMAGFDVKDSTSADRPVDDYVSGLNNPIAGLKVGVVKEFMTGDLDSGIAASTQAVLDELKRQGAEIVEVSLPNAHLSVPAYYVVAPAECSSNLSRFDGVRFGHRCDNPKDLTDLYERSRSEGFGSEVKRRIMIGAYALSAGFYDAYYIKAQKIRQLIANDFAEAFKQCDVIVSPTAPDTAFKLGEKTDDPVSMYLQDIYTIAVNLAGLPGMSIPAQHANGMPVGFQLVGNLFDEARLLNVAHQIQQATDWHLATPEGF
ncbi:MAG: Asp-tRNA(Asn)/Glu-tRNA(Gln) amidotransferase subunit GatA [Sedimenticolaceae bacterium]